MLVCGRRAQVQNQGEPLSSVSNVSNLTVTKILIDFLISTFSLERNLHEFLRYYTNSGTSGLILKIGKPYTNNFSDVKYM